MKYFAFIQKYHILLIVVCVFLSISDNKAFTHAKVQEASLKKHQKQKKSTLNSKYEKSRLEQIIEKGLKRNIIKQIETIKEENSNTNGQAKLELFSLKEEDQYIIETRPKTYDEMTVKDLISIRNDYESQI